MRILANMRILALVTAKSHSQRFAYKNKQVLHGKPLYKWTTDFLEDNKDFFNALVFSSDKPHSFNLGDDWLKIIRPQYLIEDTTPHICSVKHALEGAEYVNSARYDAVMLFQPTNPLRNVQMLYHALAMLEHHNFNTLPDTPYEASCVYVDHNLNKSYLVGAQFGDMEGNPNVRSGALYVYNRERLIDTEKDICRMYMYVKKEFGYNINDELDFKIVEAMIKYRGVKYGGRC